jgi:hypothetical protein
LEVRWGIFRGGMRGRFEIRRRFDEESKVQIVFKMLIQVLIDLN